MKGFLIWAALGITFLFFGLPLLNQGLGYWRYFKHVKQWVHSSEMIRSDIGKIKTIIPFGGPNSYHGCFTDGCYAEMTLKVSGKNGTGTLYIPHVILGIGYPDFHLREFKAGQAEQLIIAIEKTTEFKVPDDSDPVERLNGLLRNRDFDNRLLDMLKKKQLAFPPNLTITSTLSLWGIRSTLEENFPEQCPKVYPTNYSGLQLEEPILMMHNVQWLFERKGQAVEKIYW